MSKKDEMRKVRDEVIAFKKSPLYQYRIENNYVPVIGDGDHDADIMFIGEAPGKNEAISGKPFCGASGRILDELLASINVDRATVYVANILKDRPPENRDPTPAEIEMYTPFLDRQIQIIEPKVIASLGRFAMKYIMKKFDLESELLPIGKMHGRVFESKENYLGVPVTIVPLYHPAVAVYNSTTKDNLKKDFAILKNYLGSRRKKLKHKARP